MKKQTKLWTTKDGRKIRICDMEDSHLVNTIKMVAKNGEMNLTIQTLRILHYIEDAPDGAAMCAEIESDRMFSALEEKDYSSFCPLWDNLINEAEDRDLIFE